MKNLKDIIYIVIIVLILIIARDWIKDTVITTLGGFTDKEVTTKIDSTYSAGKADTIAIFRHYVKTKGIILNPKPKIEYKYKYLHPVTKEPVEADSIKKFTVNVTDSLIDGNFTAYNNFKGDLLDGYLNYKPKFPKYIKQTDTIYKTITNTETLSNKKSLIGIGVGYNNLQYPSILGSFTTKDKWQIIIEYGKPLDKVKDLYNNNTSFQFYQSDLYSLKILKHF